MRPLDAAVATRNCLFAGLVGLMLGLVTPSSVVAVTPVTTATALEAAHSVSKSASASIVATAEALPLVALPSQATEPAALTTDTLPLVVVPKARTVKSSTSGKFYSRTDVQFEQFNFNRDVVATAKGVLPFTRTPVGTLTATPLPEDVAGKLLKSERSRTQVTRFTVTETLGWKLGSRWSVEAETPWAAASFKGLAGDLQRPPTITPDPTGGSTGDNLGDLVSSLATPGNNGDFTQAQGINVAVTPGGATPLDFELSGMKDMTLRPRWERPQSDGKHRLTLESSFRIPTGHPQLTPDEQLLVTALGEASLDVDEPYFGKGFDAGMRAKWDVKAGTKREWEFTLGYTNTGEYDQTYSPQLNRFFDQGRDAMVDTALTGLEAGGLFLVDAQGQPVLGITSDTLRRSFGRSTTANSRFVTRRNPADQINAGVAFTLRPHDRRRDQYALAAVQYQGESVTNPAGIVFGDLGDAAPSRVSLKKDPAYQFSYTLDRLVTKSLFGRFRLFYQVQGNSDVATPSGFVVRDLSFGDRWGGDLQFRRKLKVPGSWLNYGMRVNCINGASVRETLVNGVVADTGIPYSDRREYSFFSGWERQLRSVSFGGTIRAGVTDDAPDLILEAGFRKEF